MRSVLLLSFILVSFLGFAQREISGTITDSESGETLIGASVLVKGTSTGTTTDIDGNFSLKLPEGSNTIVVSYTGYRKQEVDVSGKSQVNIDLEEASIGLDQVVVSASRRKEKLLEAPASVSVIEAKQIRSEVSTNPSDYIKNVSGVDIMRTGLAQTNVVLRGFNNIFSGATLTLVDYRIAAVPSLRVNVNQLLPGNYLDIDRVEVLKGPASALYGPNAASGAVHFITRSPLDEEKDFSTTVSLGGGERETFTAQLRHVGTIKKSTEESPLEIGYKISGQYLQAQDWPYIDPEEPDSIVFGKQTAEGRVPITGDTVDNSRNNQLRNYNADARVDFRFNRNTELIFAGGFSNASGIELTGLGAAQAVNWSYTYGQVRFRHRNWFAQAYMNASDAGDTYLLRSGNLIVDKSKFYVGQLQHSWEPIKNKLRFIYGADALLTRPDTEGTINGRNEDNDNIDIYGAYLQGDYDVTSWLKFVAAARLDYNTSISDPFVSPRAAAVIKPVPGHNFRVTYNRAFSSPTALTQSLDILESQDAFGLTQVPGIDIGIDGRGVGNRDGFIFSRTDNGTLQFLSPFLGYPNVDPSTFINLNNPNFNNNVLDPLGTIIAAAMISQDVPSGAANLVANEVITPQGSGNMVDIGNQIFMLDLDGGAFILNDTINPDEINDIAPIKNQVTNTFEIGYNGMIADRMVVKVDGYRSDITDFVSPLTLQTPNVFLDEEDLVAAFQRNIDSSDVQDLELLLGFIFDDPNNGGNANGTAADELAALAAGVPIGTVSPESANDPSLRLTYGNFGDVTVYGVDFELIYFLTKQIRLGGTYSYVNKDEFETGGYTIALNAPQHKTNLTAQWDIKKIGLNVGARWRWQAGFPANSGVYVGDVPSLHHLDLSFDYKLPFSEQTRVSVTVQNVYNNQFREFVGVPTMGRLTLFRVSHTF